MNHSNLPQKCHSSLEITRFRTQSQGGCDILRPQHWCYTNLTNYEFSCKSLMQLSRNSSHKPGTNLSDFFNLLLDGIQDGFENSFRKKKKCIFEVVQSYENDFHEILH